MVGDGYRREYDGFGFASRHCYAAGLPVRASLCATIITTTTGILRRLGGRRIRRRCRLIGIGIRIGITACILCRLRLVLLQPRGRHRPQVLPDEKPVAEIAHESHIMLAEPLKPARLRAHRPLLLNAHVRPLLYAVYLERAEAPRAARRGIDLLGGVYAARGAALGAVQVVSQGRGLVRPAGVDGPAALADPVLEGLRVQLESRT